MPQLRGTGQPERDAKRRKTGTMRTVNALALSGLLLAACGSQATVTPAASGAPTATVTTSATANAATGTSCDASGPDLLVRYITPSLSPAAQTLGSVAHTASGCEPTVTFLQQTSPTGAGYCTQVALASDNPGYNVDANPAPPLKKLIAQFGAC